MKNLLHFIAFGIIVLLGSCGDFYTFEDTEPEGEMSMRVVQDTVYIMTGDTIPLQVSFTPSSLDSLPVFWYPANGVDTCVKVVNDTLTALRRGELDMVAVGGSGRLADTCHIVVIDRWTRLDFNREQPSDMVIYANITIGGKPWDPATQQVVAVVRGQLAGFAEPHEAHGVSYSQLRIWSIDDEDVGTVILLCYDQSRRWLYRAVQQPDFTALSALGTLSSLYQINF